MCSMDDANVLWLPQHSNQIQLCDCRILAPQCMIVRGSPCAQVFQLKIETVVMYSCHKELKDSIKPSGDVVIH